MGSSASNCLNRRSRVSQNPDQEKQVVLKEVEAPKEEETARPQELRGSSPEPKKSVLSGKASYKGFDKDCEGEDKRNQFEGGNHNSSHSADSADQGTGKSRSNRKVRQEERQLEVTTVQTIIEKHIIIETDAPMDDRRRSRKSRDSASSTPKTPSDQFDKCSDNPSTTDESPVFVKQPAVAKEQTRKFGFSVDTPYTRDCESPQPQYRSRITSSVDSSFTNDVDPTNIAAMKFAKLKLHRVMDGLLTNSGQDDQALMIESLQYAIAVLDYHYKQKRKLAHAMDDDSSENSFDETISRVSSVDNTVRNWLVSTFTRSSSRTGNHHDHDPFSKPKSNLSMTNLMRIGIMVERFRRSLYRLVIPDDLKQYLKKFCYWDFDVFELHRASGGHSLRFLCFEAVSRFGICARFKIRRIVVEKFLSRVEEGYCLHRNAYHNVVHGADVTQATLFYLAVSNIVEWLSDLEVFTVIIASAIHDYEHTGTTNNFHINTKSDISLLYNDRSVLENYHVSTVFRFTNNDPETNIFSGLTPQEFKELRSLLIEIVLNTDMQFHFSQVKNMRQTLNMLEADPSPSAVTIDKSKVLSMIVHSADVSHPGRTWPFHLKWTQMLCHEFFDQGDREKQLGMNISPLCDRATTNVASSQVGFIDFIVAPTFDVVIDMLECILSPIFSQHKVRLGNKLPTLDEGAEEDEHSIPLHVAKKPRNSYGVSDPLADNDDFEAITAEMGQPSKFVPFKWDGRNSTLKIWRFYADNIESNKAMWRKHIEDEVNDPMFFKRFERDPVVELGWVWPEQQTQEKPASKRGSNLEAEHKKTRRKSKAIARQPSEDEGQKRRQRQWHQQQENSREKAKILMKSLSTEQSPEKEGRLTYLSQLSHPEYGRGSVSETARSTLGSRHSSLDLDDDDENSTNDEHIARDTESPNSSTSYRCHSDPGV